MDTTDFTAVLKVLKACGESIRWVDYRPLSEVWDICPRDDWKKWLLVAVNHPAWKMYDDVDANAWKAYDADAQKVYGNARKVYQDAMANAQRVYEDAMANAYKDLLAVDVQSVQEAIDTHFLNLSVN